MAALPPLIVHSAPVPPRPLPCPEVGEDLPDDVASVLRPALLTLPLGESDPVTMSVLVPIGDFSRMTHLSVKALRFYPRPGLLEPARIDPSSGYRFYDTGQVPVAQVIRRFRDLDMPLDQVRAVLTAPDVETRTKEIIAHLSAMESKLAELQTSVSSLRALLEAPAVRPEVEFRSIPATRALAVRGKVTTQQAWAWGTDVFGEI